MAELFVSGGLAARLQGRSGEKTDLDLATGRVMFDGPMVVLLNRSKLGSRRDYGERHSACRAGRARRWTNLRDAVRFRRPFLWGTGRLSCLSVSQYFTPDDKPLLGEGIEPSVEVDEACTAEDRVGDPILEKGLEVLAETETPAKVAA